MARNKPYHDNSRKGEVKNRAQVFNPHNDRYTKIDTKTHKFIDQMERKNVPFKGVRKLNKK